MDIAVFGTGYVGLVTGACLAEGGHSVVCVDIDAQRVRRLSAGEVPIHEPGLEPLVRANLASGRLRFTTGAQPAVVHGEVIFIAVGTPADGEGDADLRSVLEVARAIGDGAPGPRIVAIKSTVPVGTADRVRHGIAGALSARGADHRIDVVSNPEFLKEGAAVEDFMRPDRIVIGAADEGPLRTMRRVYAPFNRIRDRIVAMDVRSAELTKYAANAMLATKISLMNEIANIAEGVGADVEMVRQGIGSDPRIGWHFIYAGCGYGGSCLPKDVRALARSAAAHGVQPRLLRAVDEVNAVQQDHLFDLIAGHYGGEAGLAGRTVAVWGLAFKPDTDDMREASSRRLLERLWNAGAQVRAFDPVAAAEAARIFGPRGDLVLCGNEYEALEGADALAVVTEWKQFRSPDFARIRRSLRDAVVFDGRNVYTPEEIEAAGIAYYGIGRGRSVRRTREVA